jgi:hypothetical protein
MESAHPGTAAAPATDAAGLIGALRRGLPDGRLVRAYEYAIVFIGSLYGTGDQFVSSDTFCRWLHFSRHTVIRSTIS